MFKSSYHGSDSKLLHKWDLNRVEIDEEALATCLASF